MASFGMFLEARISFVIVKIEKDVYCISRLPTLFLTKSVPVWTSLLVKKFSYDKIYCIFCLRRIQRLRIFQISKHDISILIESGFTYRCCISDSVVNSVVVIKWLFLSSTVTKDEENEKYYNQNAYYNTNNHTNMVVITVAL